MRLVEVYELTDAHAKPNGLLIERHKGSRNTITAWNDRLKASWNELISRRNKIFSERNKTLPANEHERYLFYSDKTGDRLAYESLKTAMTRIKSLAKEKDPNFVNFRFHDLKRKGVTETQGSDEDKQKASGHRSAQMLKTYDKEIHTVNPTKD